MLAVGETWLRNIVESSIISIPNYTLLRSDKSTGARGGRVALFRQFVLLLSDKLGRPSIELCGRYGQCYILYLK